MILLVSAVLFTGSLYNVSRVDLGLEVDHLVTFGISPERNGYAREQSGALFERLEDELGGAAGGHRCDRLAYAVAGREQLGAAA